MDNMVKIFPFKLSGDRIGSHCGLTRTTAGELVAAVVGGAYAGGY